WCKLYYEAESGSDGRIEFKYQDDGTAIVTGIRPEFFKILAQVRERYRATGRPQVICVSPMLNRLGRSGHTLTLIYDAAVATQGNLYIWGARDGIRLLNPLNPSDKIQ